MEIGCSYELGMIFDEQPNYDDILVEFKQGDDVILEYHLADINIVTSTDDDDNTVYTGWLHLYPADTSKFAPGVATCKAYAITGNDKLPSDAPMVIHCKR